MSLPKISVVIGTFNQKPILERVLTSFLDQTLPKSEFEIVIVDSTSSDGTPEMVASFADRLNVRVIVQPNTGKAAARNRGAREASAPLLLFTDGDLIAHPNLLSEHVNAHQNSQGPRCYQGLEYNMTRLDWPPTPDQLKPIVPNRVRNGQKIGWYYWLTGNLSVPKSTFLTLGVFDEEFTGYGFEDIECGYRLFKAGIFLFYLKTAINYHYHLITPEVEVERAEKKGRSAALFYKKHPELKWYLGMNPVSLWVHGQLSASGYWVTLARSTMKTNHGNWKYRLSGWFLHEFGYLTGATDALRTGRFQ